MAGIYIHIPFCKKRCSYCDFHKETRISDVPSMVVAIIKELEIRRLYLRTEPIGTIYFGGGTPSVLQANQLQLIFKAIEQNFSVLPDAEITLEANPDDLTESYLKELTNRTPINRLSMGIQSFNPEELKILNRRHDRDQAINAVEMATKSGINNISIDLIYGLPSQSLDGWKQNLETALELPVSHLSCYHLIYEKGTPMFQWRENRKVFPVKEDVSLAMFEHLIERTTQTGFEHYEISNFAKPGKRSKHNSAYWQGEPYLGIGPSAHSYNGQERSWNIADNKQYENAIRDGRVFSECEIIDLPTRYNDYIVTSLRTKEGSNIKKIQQSFGEEYQNHCLKSAQKHIAKGDLLLDSERLYLSKSGIFISDGIMSDLLWV